jgi:hypothetical protein
MASLSGMAVLPFRRVLVMGVRRLTLAGCAGWVGARPRYLSSRWPQRCFGEGLSGALQLAQE